MRVFADIMQFLLPKIVQRIIEILPFLDFSIFGFLANRELSVNADWYSPKEIAGNNLNLPQSVTISKTHHGNLIELCLGDHFYVFIGWNFILFSFSASPLYKTCKAGIRRYLYKAKTTWIFMCRLSIDFAQLFSHIRQCFSCFSWQCFSRDQNRKYMPDAAFLLGLDGCPSFYQLVWTTVAPRLNTEQFNTWRHRLKW